MKSLFLFALAVTAQVNQIIISSTPTGTGPINADYSGLAVEYFGILDLFLIYPNVPIPPPAKLQEQLRALINPAILQLLTNLASPMKIPLIIRVGGNSANRLALANSALPPLSPDLFSIKDGSIMSPFNFQILDYVSNVTGIKLTMAIGMPTSQPIYAQQWIDVIRNNINRKNILAIEVGNEPDHFAAHGWRPTTYAYFISVTLHYLDRYPDYLQEYKVYSGLVKASFGQDVNLMGPSYVKIIIILLCLIKGL